jgi:hypothetical protein
VKLKIVLLGLCAVGLGVGLGGLYMSNTKMATELEQLRAQNLELQNAQNATEESAGGKLQKANEELARLRKDNEELLRLRNDVRQLRDENQQLNKQVQSAQSQAQNAQAQIQTAQAQAKAQVEAMRTNQILATRFAVNAGTPEQQANVCINNLRQIDGAKQQWALENNRPANAPVMPADIVRYFPNNAFPACPAGGAYTLNVVGAPPVCSIPGHALPR